jgi:hypothetical protein
MKTMDNYCTWQIKTKLRCQSSTYPSKKKKNLSKLLGTTESNAELLENTKDHFPQVHFPQSKVLFH